MKTEYNDPSVIKYYKAPISRANCTIFLFDINEPISCEILQKYASVYSLFSTSVPALYMRIPFAEVMNRSFGWANTTCIYEELLKDTSQRIGLFLLQQDIAQKAFRLLPQYAYSIAFFAGAVNVDRLLDSLKRDFLSVLSNPPALWEAASAANAVLIHCISGWDGYSINYINGQSD